jgi:hypothetical protein
MKTEILGKQKLRMLTRREKTGRKKNLGTRLP